MYAVIQTGGKQYKVAAGDVVCVEKLDAEVGETVDFDVLMSQGAGGLVVGKPLVDGARVIGKVVEQGKAQKVIVFKHKPKKDYKKTNGHRQPFTKVEITAIP